MATTPCGPAGWNMPKPGDPSNFLPETLRATSAFGGIEIQWAMPLFNPHAVIFTRIYRGLISQFDGATPLADVGGNYHFDRTAVESPSTFYYWIQYMSINGTVGEPIGPVSAMARPMIAQTIEMLSQQINESTLSLALNTRLDEINLLGANLAAEITAREDSRITLAAAIDEAKGEAAQALTFIADETRSRTTNEASMIAHVDLVAATMNGHYAAFTESVTAEVDVVKDKTEVIYTATLDVDGKIGGFGFSNDGTAVHAGFIADRLWIGGTEQQFTTVTTAVQARDPVTDELVFDVNGDPVMIETTTTVPVLDENNNPVWIQTVEKPFIIDEGIVYIKEAAINKVSFNKLIADDGKTVVQDGGISADYLNIKGINVESLMYNDQGQLVLDEEGTPMKDKNFAIDEDGNAFFRGHVEALSGTFHGSLMAGTLDPSAFVGERHPYPYLPPANPGYFTITVPTAAEKGWSAVSMRVILQGAGGGGGGGTWDYSGTHWWMGAGGGGGAGTQTTFTADNIPAGTTYRLFIGAGGAGGVAGYDHSNTAGSAGGDTILKTSAGVTLKTGAGGGGGAKGACAVVAGGTKGGKQGGFYQDEGTYDHLGNRYPATVTGGYMQGMQGIYGGKGGNSVYAAGGNGGSGWSAVENSTAGDPGKPGVSGSGGGGGGCKGPNKGSAGKGGKGGNGYALVEFYDPNSVVLNNRYSKLIEWLITKESILGVLPGNAK